MLLIWNILREMSWINGSMIWSEVVLYKVIRLHKWLVVPYRWMRLAKCENVSQEKKRKKKKKIKKGWENKNIFIYIEWENIGEYCSQNLISVWTLRSTVASSSYLADSSSQQDTAGRRPDPTCCYSYQPHREWGVLCPGGSRNPQDRSLQHQSHRLSKYESMNEAWKCTWKLPHKIMHVLRAW